jgi:K+ transporter
VVAYAVTGVFLIIALAFFGANALKIAHGGWVPLVIGGILFTLLATWKTGRQIVAKRLTRVPSRSKTSWPPSPRPARPGSRAPRCS